MKIINIILFVLIQLQYIILIFRLDNENINSQIILNENNFNS